MAVRLAPATTAYPPPISFIYPDRGNFIAFAFAGDVDARALVRESISLLRKGGGNGQVLARSAGAMLLAPGQVLSDRPLRDLQVGDGGEDSLAYAMDMCRRQAQAPETCQTYAVNDEVVWKP